MDIREESVGKLTYVFGAPRIEWGIKNYSQLTTDKGEIFSLKSPFFEMHAATWNLTIRISEVTFSFSQIKKNVLLDLEKRYSQLEEHCVYYKSEIIVDGKVEVFAIRKDIFRTNTMRSAEVSETLSCFEDPQQTNHVKVILYIYPEESTINKLMAYYSDSTTMACEGVDNLLTDVKDLYLNHQDCDLKIRVKTREFGVHKVILAARSPVFNAMLHHDMAEKNNGVVEIVDFEPDIFHHFLLYLYTGRVEVLSWDNVIQLFIIGDKYDLQYLKNQCVKYMTIQICVDRFFEVLDFAIKYKESALLKVAEEFFVKNVHLICKSEKWQGYMDENSAMCNKLFMKYISVLNEERSILEEHHKSFGIPSTQRNPNAFIFGKS